MDLIRSLMRRVNSIVNEGGQSRRRWWPFARTVFATCQPEQTAAMETKRTAVGESTVGVLLLQRFAQWNTAGVTVELDRPRISIGDQALPSLSDMFACELYNFMHVSMPTPMGFAFGVLITPESLSVLFNRTFFPLSVSPHSVFRLPCAT